MKKKYGIIGASSIILLLIFFTTDPATVPSFILVLPFVLLTIMLYITLAFLLERQGRPNKKSRRLAILCTALPVLLLILQSIGQLTIRDVVAAAVVFLLSFFYISRMTSARAA